MATDEDYNSPEYKAWRYHCLTRDNFTCVVTGQKGGELEVHHIVPVSKNDKLKYVPSNGITLAKSFHESIRGKEEQYETMFKRLVNQNTLKQQMASGKNKKAIFKEKKKYRPRNPRNYLF